RRLEIRGAAGNDDDHRAGVAGDGDRVDAVGRGAVRPADGRDRRQRSVARIRPTARAARHDTVAVVTADVLAASDPDPADERHAAPQRARVYGGMTREKNARRGG